MSVVYLARDLRHERDVAIKVLRPEIALAGQLARFLREIQITARLNHPNILPLLDSGEVEDLLFYVMPFVPNGSLKHRLLQERMLALEEVRQVTSQVAAALDYAHSAQSTLGEGIVHRDIKPENVLLTEEGHVYLADFGIARILSTADHDALTSYGIIVGTWPYMSPEQCAGDKRVDHRSDVYSLGCLVYEMLTGETPFTGPSGQAIAAKHMGQAAPALSVVRPDAPASVSHAVAKALAKAPAQRFQKAGDFAAALSAVSPPLPPPANWRIRRLAAVGVVAAALSLGAYVLSIRSTKLHQHDWVVVADFKSPADDPGLGGAVRELVTTELNQSKFIQTFPKQQLLGAMRLAGVPETTQVSVKLARELAYRNSIRALLVGSVERLEDAYSITLHVVDADNGNTIYTTAARAANARDLIPTVDDLAKTLRKGLGERPDAIAANRPLLQLATPSFDAYRKYSDGMERSDHGDIDGSNRLLSEALAVDSTFASAWAAKGLNYIAGRQLDSAEIALKLALRHPERLTDAYRYRLEGDLAYTVRHDLPAAIKWYELYLTESPWSYAGHNNRALYLSSMGRHEEALEEFKQAVLLNPLGPAHRQIELLNEAAEYVVLGRLAEARRSAEQLVPPFSQYTTLLLAVAEDRWADAESAATVATAAKQTPSYLRIFANTAGAAALAARGDAPLAAHVLDSLVAGNSGALGRWYVQARLLLAQASGPAAGPMPPWLARDTTVAGIAWQGIWLAVANDIRGAIRRRERLGQADSMRIARLGATSRYLDAWIAARKGQWREVADGIGHVALVGEHDATILDRVGSHSLRWLAARAYDQLRLYDSVAIYLDPLVKPVRIPPGHFALRGLVVAPVRDWGQELAAKRGSR